MSQEKKEDNEERETDKSEDSFSNGVYMEERAGKPFYPVPSDWTYEYTTNDCDVYLTHSYPSKVYIPKDNKRILLIGPTTTGPITIYRGSRNIRDWFVKEKLNEMREYVEDKMKKSLIKGLAHYDLKPEDSESRNGLIVQMESMFEIRQVRERKWREALLEKDTKIAHWKNIATNNNDKKSTEDKQHQQQVPSFAKLPTKKRNDIDGINAEESTPQHTSNKRRKTNDNSNDDGKKLPARKDPKVISPEDKKEARRKKREERKLNDGPEIVAKKAAAICIDMDTQQQEQQRQQQPLSMVKKHTKGRKKKFIAPPNTLPITDYFPYEGQELTGAALVRKQARMLRQFTSTIELQHRLWTEAKKKS